MPTWQLQDPTVEFFESVCGEIKKLHSILDWFAMVQGQIRVSVGPYGALNAVPHRKSLRQRHVVQVLQVRVCKIELCSISRDQDFLCALRHASLRIVQQIVSQKSALQGPCKDPCRRCNAYAMLCRSYSNLA